MANTVDKVIAIAEEEVGYLEKSKAAYLKDKTVLDRKTDGAGYDNYTKYGRDMHAIYPSVMDFPAPYCDCFVDWCFYKAYGITNAKGLLAGDFDDYTVASAQLYKNKKAWYASNPKVGDQIFFKNDVRICHTGLVYKVDSNNVYTIEGNTSVTAGNGISSLIPNGGGVCKKQYPLNYNKIAGYGRPKYDVEPLKTYKISTGKKGLRVTQDLNIRNNPGTSNTTVIDTYKKNNYVFPTEKTFVNNKPWYKTDKGWISARYLEGWVKEENNKWWYVKENYSFTTNDWQKIDGEWYFFDAEGYMKTGWIEWKNQWYYLDNDGKMVTDTYVKSDSKDVMYYINKDGIWDKTKDKQC